MKQDIIEPIEITKTKRKRGKINCNTMAFEVEESSCGFGEATPESDAFIDSIILKSTIKGGDMEQ